MNIKFLLGIIVIFVAVSQKNYAQELSYIDSLKLELKKSKNASDSTRILCRLCWNTSESNKCESIQYGKQALKTAKRLNDSLLIADGYDAAALAYNLEGNKEKAKEYYKISVEIGYRNHINERIAWGNYNLAKLYMDEGRHKIAESFAMNAYKHFVKVGEQRKAFDCYWLLVRFKPDQYADSLGNLIIAYIPNEKDETNKLFLYLELTSLYNKSGKKNKAMYYVQLAMELAEKNKNTKGIFKAYYQIADYFRDIQQNYSMALLYYEKILELSEQLHINKKGDIYNQIGDIYRLEGNDSLAINYFNKALEEGKRNKHRHTMASAFMKIGDVNYHRKQYNDALYYYLKCYETNCDVCPRIAFHDALVNIGSVYLFSNDIKKAEYYYTKSLEIADSASDLRAQAHSWQAFAIMYEEQGDLNKAITYNHKALDISKKAQYLKGQQINSERLSALYEKIKDFRNALRFLNLSDQLKDSINKINEIDNLAKFETYFDFKNLQVQRELDNARSDEEISQQKLLRNFFIGGFVLIIIVGLLIFRSYQRKKAANKLLEEQKRSIEKMSEKVHEADQAKLEFFTNVSHELKTPLTLILGMTEKLKATLKENNSIGIIRKNANKLLQLVNHLLDLRKIDTSKMCLNVKEGNLEEFIKGIISSFENLINQKNITFEYRSYQNDSTEWFDHDKLEKIFSNLLSNAIKYTNSNGIIKVALTERNDGFAEINVSDNGIGISENELPNIFERFYRVPGNINHGSGIGLALVKELVNLHKGEIKVNCKKNMGSSFTVILPVDKQHYNENEILLNEEEQNNWNFVDILDDEDEPSELGPIAEPNPNNKTILVVEDNSDLRRFIVDIFVNEYDVLEACDGLEGFKKSLEFVPDIIISDIVMPNMSGIQLVDKLKNDIATSHIPIILLTAKNDMATHLSSFEKGVDDFISKPFNSIILKSRVENLLRLRKQLVEKFSQQFKLQPREITIENADQKFLQKAIEIIEKNMSNPNLNVDLLAMELGVSRTQLYRKLNALTDYPPKHFIRIIRLKRAAQILQQGQNNIAEVMDATGFSNYSYFNNCFKDFFGKFPKDYAIISVKGNLN